MRFSEIVKEAKELLQGKGRVTYRALKLEFDLDDERLDVLKDELIKAERVATDEGGEILVWTGNGEPSPVSANPEPQAQPPATCTPQHLAERIRAEQAAMESRGSADGERKTITALFADLKGSTALIEGLDPEDARAIIDPALQLMMDAVHRYDGYVAQALGDGIFALFGAPIAHEDHPQRALYAALRMQEEMRQHSDQSRLKGGIPLQLRVGINTGEVVVRSIRKDDLHTDYVPVGHSTNLAARMEQMANPGSIVISEYTRKLTEGYFDLKALGAAEIKGVEEPLNVYEVIGAGPLRTRLQVSARRGLTRFVGRHSEMDQLQQALVQAKERHGQIVGVMGEPGLGKSRLFYEFKLAAQSGCLVLEAFAVSHGKASPYLPLIELLKTYFQIEPHDDERQRQEKITGRMLTLDRSLEDTLPYLFSLLGIEDPQSSLQQMDPQIRRQRTFEALKKLFLRESLNQPLILIFEDLHWIDSETQGFLDLLSESIASAKLLLLVNYRPEYRPEWGQKTYYTQLRLSPLGKDEAEELLTFLLGPDVGATGRSPLQALKQLILERTEGTPFFMEEVVQTLAEEGALIGERGHFHLEQTPTELHISPTVQGVLAARIDRLTAEEKDLLQQLAVIGRQFPASLMKQVVTQSEDERHRLLSSLQSKEFLYEQPAFPEVEYLFKHALTQEVAYGTVLQEQRKALHEKTGEAMEALYTGKLEDHYGTLAYHYRLSGNAEKAVEYLRLAGEYAARHSASAEATRAFTEALDLLLVLPATQEQQRHELALQLALGNSLLATQGHAGAEVEQAYLRAKELCAQSGDETQLCLVLSGLSRFHISRADFVTAQAEAKEFLNIALRLRDSTLLMGAYRELGEAVFWQGAFASARTQLEHGAALYRTHGHRSTALLFGQDAGLDCLSRRASTLWYLGYPDQARQQCDEALRLARAQGHTMTLGGALVWGAFLLATSREDVRTMQAWCEEMTKIATDNGMPLWPMFADLFRGWTMAKHGQQESGIQQIRQALSSLQTIGFFAFTQFVGAYLLADAYGQAHQEEQGLAVLAPVLTEADTTREHAWEAILYWLKGDLLSRQSQEPQAEACFRKAIDIAQHQQAKSWELRAATSLARLWQGQGKVEEAREVLAPVYNWFTEGFDTADLKDAKALLDTLS